MNSQLESRVDELKQETLGTRPGEKWESEWPHLASVATHQQFKKHDWVICHKYWLTQICGWLNRATRVTCHFQIGLLHISLPPVSGIFTMGLLLIFPLLYPIRNSKVHLSLLLHLFYPQLIVSGGACHDQCFAIPLSSVSHQPFLKPSYLHIWLCPTSVFPLRLPEAILAFITTVLNQKTAEISLLDIKIFFNLSWLT